MTPSSKGQYNIMDRPKIVIDKEHDLVVVFRWMDDSKIAEAMRLIIQSAGG